MFIVLHRDELEAIPDQEKREDRLTELNVQEQVLHLAKTSIIQRAWKHRKGPDLHGLVYGLKDGLLNPSSPCQQKVHWIHCILIMILVQNSENKCGSVRVW